MSRKTTPISLNNPADVRVIDDNFIIVENELDNLHNIKQNRLTAGIGINISDDDVISVSGGGGGGLKYIEKQEGANYGDGIIWDGDITISNQLATPDSFEFIASENIYKVLVVITNRVISGSTAGDYHFTLKNIFLTDLLLYSAQDHAVKIIVPEFDLYFDMSIMQGSAGVNLHIKTKNQEDPDFRGEILITCKLIY